MTNKELVRFCESKIGVNYVYGMKGQVMTLERYNILKQLYGNLVWDSDRKKIGTVCIDCSGLISWATGVYYNTKALYSNASYKADIKTIADAPAGAILWKEGHCGVYIGNGYCIEARDSETNTVKAKVTDTQWTHWLKMPYIEYTAEGNNEGTTAPSKPSSYTPGIYEVTQVSALNVRSKPDANSAVTGKTVSKGTRLTVSKIENRNWGYIAELGGWCNISSDYCKKIKDVEETTQPAAGKTYTVKKGDTLGQIASRFGTTVENLVKLNGIQDANLIQIGQVLQLTKKAETQQTKYTVSKGDTLIQIANRFGTTAGKIASLNGIEDPNVIRVGQVLQIPK